MVSMSRGVIAPPAFSKTTPEAIEMNRLEADCDGVVHIYVGGKDSGMRIELDADGVLVIHPGNSARWRVQR